MTTQQARDHSCHQQAAEAHLHQISFNQGSTSPQRLVRGPVGQSRVGIPQLVRLVHLDVDGDVVVGRQSAANSGRGRVGQSRGQGHQGVQRREPRHGVEILAA